MAMAARRAPVPAGAPAESSCSQAPPAANTTPEHTPARNRAPPRATGVWAANSVSAVATGERATNGSTSLRRPKRSDAGPPMSRPGMSPTA